ncbi:MAG: hypothetical protein QOK05_708 [Chloroflexota bacterium]|jgi:hypothetical protein|nr:hypothetical protein [Chloroflexota bacterium]
MPERPPTALNLASGAEIRPLDDGDIALLRTLHRSGENATLAAALNIDEPGVIGALQAEPWCNPMVLLQEEQPVGAALIAPADTQHLNGRLVVLAGEPRRCTDALALYIRHAFWSHPIHRLYAIAPRGYTSHLELLRGCGFVDEGRLLGHLRVGARMQDLDVLGLLREDFDRWCAQYAPDWLL